MIPAGLLRMIARVLTAPFRRHSVDTTSAWLAKTEAEAKLAATDRWLKRLLRQQPNGRVDRDGE